LVVPFPAVAGAGSEVRGELSVAVGVIAVAIAVRGVDSDIRVADRLSFGVLHGDGQRHQCGCQRLALGDCERAALAIAGFIRYDLAGQGIVEGHRPGSGEVPAVIPDAIDGSHRHSL